MAKSWCQIHKQTERFWNTWVNNVYFIACHCHQNFYEFITTPHFWSFPTSFCPAALLLHDLLTCSVYSVTLLALCIFLFPSRASWSPCPGFSCVSPSQRFPLCAIKDSRQATGSLLVTGMRRNFLCCLTPPAPSAKPLPPKRQWDKGKRFSEELDYIITFSLRHMAVQLLYTLVDSVLSQPALGSFFSAFFIWGAHISPCRREA